MNCRRRARQRPALLSAFNQNLAMFERGWYGMYDVDLATIQQFEVELRAAEAACGAIAPFGWPC